MLLHLASRGSWDLSSWDLSSRLHGCTQCTTFLSTSLCSHKPTKGCSCRWPLQSPCLAAGSQPTSLGFRGLPSLLPPSPVLSRQGAAHPAIGIQEAITSIGFSSLLPWALPRTSVSSSQTHPTCVTVKQGTAYSPEGSRVGHLSLTCCFLPLVLNLPDLDTSEVPGDPPSMMCLIETRPAHGARSEKQRCQGFPRASLHTVPSWGSGMPLGFITQVATPLL